ncbi:MAG: hypothetical protein IT223_11905, partial [Crocinitomicaceae bacterium]|nr:hypothetical protein [Crocinitomicaceae bacterium]
SGLRGLDELKFYPGLFARFGWLFEYSNYREGLKGIEAGVSVDAFMKRIPIMSDRILVSHFDGAKNHQIFVGLYINFFFGRKYNRHEQ